ncbi:D site-binding protein [Lingula anatina]|uniref:D site-binding protein n=1 Tax=Lingula anatina TaxID=7574 RepID=A0A1S3INS4_LINAN|nr:D site-binding protein [Lingula anatina]XP_013399894.1 D site-binding protein [Lingula anatina]XP_013399895.1 D site-binding protein [Lingula anatina]|eukprot:XP_013399893.1 D site-binding protein [Lingula anatina]
MLCTAPGEPEFDPRRHTVEEGDVMPRPAIRRIKRKCIPENDKDEEYWKRRRKNNEQAKRSRDTRRLQENRIKMHVIHLKSELKSAKEQLKNALLENARLRSVVNSQKPDDG